MKLTFNRTYFAFTILIFWIEVGIALYIHDDFIRPYMGDVLVVMLMYCFIKSFFNLPMAVVAGFVLCFAFAIEGLQFLNVVALLGLQHSKLARTVLGTSFSWIDLLTYIIGIAVVIVVEKYAKKAKPKTH
jgi:uncharacterized membrane protein YuzA (DUF378 family)